VPIIFWIMNRVKYLSVILAGTVIYVLMSLAVGQNSVRCLRYMERQKRLVSIRTAEIQDINNELALELAALRKDKAVIAAYARKLDYVADGEKLVKITGLKPASTTLYNTGTVLRADRPDYVPERYCKMAALCFSFFYFLIIFMLDVGNGRIQFGKGEKSVVTGIPIYDIPQI